MLEDTAAYKLMRDEYIRRHSFKKLLEANIAQLERELAAYIPDSTKRMDFIETDIKLPDRKFEKLRMYFFIHPETGNCAPFWLQLLRDPQRKRLGASGMKEALEQVLNELGW